LKQSRLFEHASVETIANCEHLFVQHVCVRGKVLFEQGDDARFVFLIKRGMVRVARRTTHGKEVTIAILGPGSLFGEEVVFSQVERRTIAVCMAESLLCMARGEHLYGLLTRYPALAINVAKFVSEQRSEALTIAEDLAYLTVPQRLMQLFSRLATEYGMPVSGGIRLNIRLTHADIASLVGSTRETISAQLARLTRDGQIRLNDRSIVILDQPASV
jgi:CRP/FNR family cyclic AMP-dependent transcriptional regulator